MFWHSFHNRSKVWMKNKSFLMSKILSLNVRHVTICDSLQFITSNKNIDAENMDCLCFLILWEWTQTSRLQTKTASKDLIKWHSRSQSIVFKQHQFRCGILISTIPFGNKSRKCQRAYFGRIANGHKQVVCRQKLPRRRNK